MNRFNMGLVNLTTKAAAHHAKTPTWRYVGFDPYNSADRWQAVARQAALGRAQPVYDGKALILIGDTWCTQETADAMWPGWTGQTPEGDWT